MRTRPPVTPAYRRFGREKRRARVRRELASAGDNGVRHALQRRLAWLGDVPIHDARPRTRGDCVDGARPCPWVGCRHHLYLEVTAHGAISPNTARAPEEMEESCALDVADRGPHSMAEIGRLIGLSRERIRQVADAAMAKVRNF